MTVWLGEACVGGQPHVGSDTHQAGFASTSTRAAG